MNTNSKGFTLLEILVASTILFASVVALALIYKTSFISSEKAASTVTEASVTTALLAHIQNDIRARTTQQVNNLVGDGVMWGVNYRWRAAVQEVRPPPERFDYDMGEFRTYPARYKLWLVTVDIQSGMASEQFQYNELSWF